MDVEAATLRFALLIRREALRAELEVGLPPGTILEAACGALRSALGEMIGDGQGESLTGQDVRTVCRMLARAAKQARQSRAVH